MTELMQLGRRKISYWEPCCKMFRPTLQFRSNHTKLSVMNRHKQAAQNTLPATLLCALSSKTALIGFTSLQCLEHHKLTQDGVFCHPHCPHQQQEDPACTVWLEQADLEAIYLYIITSRQYVFMALTRLHVYPYSCFVTQDASLHIDVYNFWSIFTLLLADLGRWIRHPYVTCYLVHGVFVRMFANSSECTVSIGKRWHACVNVIHGYYSDREQKHSWIDFMC